MLAGVKNGLAFVGRAELSRLERHFSTAALGTLLINLDTTRTLGFLDTGVELGFLKGKRPAGGLELDMVKICKQHVHTNQGTQSESSTRVLLDRIPEAQRPSYRNRNRKENFLPS